MPDISMCVGKECPQKDKCYRYTAIPCEYRQAYFVTPPYTMDGCPYFTSNQTEEQDGHRISKRK